MYIVRNMTIFIHYHRNHILLGVANRFFDSELSVTGFADTNPNFAALISNHHRHRETESATTTHHASYAADTDDFLIKLWLRSFWATRPARTAFVSEKACNW